MKSITHLFRDFTESERSSGYVLLGATIVSLLLANVFLGVGYVDFFHHKVGAENEMVHLSLSIEKWINDGLMTLFFLMVGLEIKRELFTGELSSIKSASLPIAGALGGMLAPFAIYLLFNAGTATQSGYGIPMATDIAFALGVLSLIKGIPHGLKVFLTAFAIADDLGAIIIIAIFYTQRFQLSYLLLALGILAFLFILNRAKVNSTWPYLLLGVVMWYCLLQSGVHATISGVLLAFALPFRGGNEEAASYKVQHALHLPVAFFILPVFALANTGIILNSNWLSDLKTSNSMGIISGLVIGKPIGILLFSYLSVKAGWSELPDNVSWRHMLGAGVLGGIGFTMSVFITLLAFDKAEYITQAKIAILLSSIIASVIGISVLRLRGFKDGERN